MSITVALKNIFLVSVTNIAVLLTSMINLSIVCYQSNTNLYLFSVMLPLQFFLIAVQELFRATSLNLFSNEINQQHLVWIILLSIIASLSIVYCWGYFADVFIRVFNVELDKKQNINIILKTLVVTNINLVIHSILMAYMLGQMKSNQACFFTLMTSAMSIFFTIVTTRWFGCGVEVYLLNQIICFALANGILIFYFLQTRAIPKLNVHTMKEGLLIVLKQIYLIGIPVSMTTFMLFFILALMNKIMTHYNADILSGYSLAYRIQALFYMVAMSIGIALAILINYYKKLQDYKKVIAVYRAGMLIKILILFFLTLLIFKYHTTVSRILTNNIPIRQSMTTYLYYVSPSYFFVGEVLSLSILLEQFGYGMQVFLYNIIYLITIFIIYKLIFYLHLSFVLFCKLLSFCNLIISLLFILYFLVYKRHYFISINFI